MMPTHAGPAAASDPAESGALPAIHVTAQLGGRRQGAWIDTNGERMAWDREAHLVSVCPGGGLAIDVVPGEPLAHVRDLASLDVVRTIDLDAVLKAAGAVEDAPPEDVVCRSTDATDVIYRWGYSIRDGAGAEIARTAAWQPPSALTATHAYGTVGRGRRAELIDLRTGAIGALAEATARHRISAIALSPAGSKAAVVVSGRSTDELVLLEIDTQTDADPGPMVDVRLINLAPDAPGLDLATRDGATLVGSVAFGHAGWSRVLGGSVEVTLTDPVTSETLLELGSVSLEPGSSVSFVVTGSLTGGALAVSTMLDDDEVRSGAPDGWAVTRVLNGLPVPVDLMLRQRQARRDGSRGRLFATDLAPGMTTGYHVLGEGGLVIELEDAPAAEVSTDVLPDGGGRSGVAPGEAYTIAIIPSPTGGTDCYEDLRSSECFELIALSDRPAPLVGTELTRMRLPSHRKLMRTPLWVDDDTLAVVLHHRTGLSTADDAAGTVTLLDGSDLALICEWHGWDALPVTSHEGVLLGWRSRPGPVPVAVGARGGQVKRMGRIKAQRPPPGSTHRRYPLPRSHHSIVPLPGFDRSPWKGSAAGSCGRSANQ